MPHSKALLKGQKRAYISGNKEDCAKPAEEEDRGEGRVLQREDGGSAAAK